MAESAKDLALRKKKMFEGYWPSQNPTYGSAPSGKLNLIASDTPMCYFGNLNKQDGRKLEGELAVLLDVQKRMVNAVTEEIGAVIKVKHAALLEVRKADKKLLKEKQKLAKTKVSLSSRLADWNAAHQAQVELSEWASKF
jgi:hypothetical protein